MRDAQPLGEHAAVAAVAVDELDHTGRRARRTNALLDAVRVDRVEQSDAAADHERVRTALEELVGDPAEAVFELVTEAGLHASDSVRSDRSIAG